MWRSDKNGEFQECGRESRERAATSRVHHGKEDIQVAIRSLRDGLILQWSLDLRGMPKDAEKLVFLSGCHGQLRGLPLNVLPGAANMLLFGVCLRDTEP